MTGVRGETKPLGFKNNNSYKRFIMNEVSIDTDVTTDADLDLEAALAAVDGDNEGLASDEGEVEEKTSGINFAKAVIRDEHGVVNKTLTFARIEEEYSAWMEANEIDTPLIAAAVAAVFSKLPPAQMAMLDLNGVANRAVEELKVPFGSETRLSNRVKDFVRGESLRFVAASGREGMYHIKRGKKGGVRLNTPAYVEQYRKIQAKKPATSKA